MAFAGNVQAVTLAILAGTSVVNSVASSATTVTLAAARTTRLRYKIFNDSTQTAYVKEGSGASSADFTYKLLAGQFYDEPADARWTGLLTAAWASANGAMLVTEHTE